MLFKPRLALLGVLALFITSGIVTSVASANGPAWKVNGSRLGAQVKQKTKIIAGETTLKAKVIGTPTSIKCETSVVANSFIEGNGQGAGLNGASGITYETCKVTEPLKCLVAQPIKTVPVKSQLVLFGGGQGKIGDLFEPTQGTTFVTIVLENEGTKACIVAGSFPVKGTVVAEVKPENSEVLTGELAFPSVAISQIKKEGGAATQISPLEIGTGNPATFIGKYEVGLESGMKFGAFR
jgi:hypothetical protein